MHSRTIETPKIVLTDVSVTFPTSSGELLAVSDASLTVRDAEFVCIMGRSGCGKTTLLNAIAGLVEPTSGMIEVAGRRVTGPGPDRAVVFQEDAVFPWMTVEQNVGFAARVRGWSKRDTAAAAQRYLELVGLTEFGQAWPKQLSGGMKKRVDMARGYAADPDVLLMDEPFGALDVMTKEYLQEALRALWLAEPRTIIFITHDVEEALFLGDRVVVMTPRPGRIAAIYDADFGRPRDASLRVDAHFLELRRVIRERIASEEAVSV